MGIQGLLPMLKEISNSIHIKECKGQTYAVDAYVWLHRGAYGCAEELALGKKTVKYVNYAMHRVRMLKYHGVIPLIVFDGGLLPSKMGTEGSREKRRMDALAKGNAFLAEGKKSQARDCFVKAVDITPEMAYQLIKALRREGIQYIVAPYEADPQLAYLERHGFVDGVITEDSDLLVFGCQNVLFKLDGDGNCVQIKRKDFGKCREFNFLGWSEREFRQMAILSGCDYIGSIIGLGLKTSYRLMKKYKTAERVIQAVRLEGQLKVPDKYFENFKRAELTFCHQLVFDPATKNIVHFQPLPDGLTSEEVPFAGAPLEVEFARGLARGDIDPLSKLPMVDINPDQFSPTKTPWQPSTFKPTKSKGVVAATGAASLLHFFSKQAPPIASTSKIPAKKRNSEGALVKYQNGDKHGKGKGKGKEVVRGGSLQSRFFGGTTKAVQVEKEVEVLELEDTDEELGAQDQVEEEEEEEEEEEDEFPDDEDVPVEYYGSEWDEDALAHLEEIEIEFSKLPSPSPPSPLRRHDSGIELEGLLRASSPFGVVSNRQVLASSVGISSPDITPKKRRKLSSSKGTETELGNGQLSSRNIKASQSAGAITSPGISEMDDEEEEEEREVLMSSPSGSPTPSRIRQLSPSTSQPTIKLEKIKSKKIQVEKEIIIKGEKVSIVDQGGSKTLWLSSDPIELFSEVGEKEGEDLDETEEILEASTTKEMRRKKITEKEEKKQNLKKKRKMEEVDLKPLIKVKVEKKPLIYSTDVVDSDLVEEGDENLPSVAAAWRERFMNSSSSGGPSKTQKSKPKPKVTSPLASILAKSISKPTTKKQVSRVPNVIKVASARIPLSPKKSFSPVVKPYVSRQQATTSKKRLQDDLEDEAGHEDEEVCNKKVVVTTQALLRFRYKG